MAAQQDQTGKPWAQSKDADGLTQQKRLFAAEYVKDNNATRAAIRAGYSAATAQQQGSRLLKNVVVRRLIEQLQQQAIAKVQADTGITLERTLREIARIAFFDPRQMFDEDGNPMALTALSDDTAAVVAGLDVLEEWDGAGEARVLRGYVKKWKLADKKGALDMLMKHLGGYKVDNEQKKTPELTEQVASFLGELHRSGAGRLPVAKRAPKS